MLGLYSAANERLEADGGAFVPGLEFAGTVERVGEGCDFAPGDRVFGFTRFGAYADRVTTRSTLLRRCPDGWSIEEAASVLVQGLTAYYGLCELGDASQGSNVLVSSAAGEARVREGKKAGRGGAAVADFWRSWRPVAETDAARKRSFSAPWDRCPADDPRLPRRRLRTRSS